MSKAVKLKQVCFVKYIGFYIFDALMNKYSECSVKQNNKK